MSENSDDEELARAIALSLEGQDQSETKDVVDETEDEEAQLARAIAMSLEGQDQPEPRVAVDLTDETPDGKQKIPQAESSTPRTGTDKGIGTNPLLSLNRKQMEEERLARLRKRKASTSPPSKVANSQESEQHPSTSNEKQEQVDDQRKPKKRKLPWMLSEAPTSKDLAPLVDQSHKGKSADFKATKGTDSTSIYGREPENFAPGIKYPYGVVKKTWVSGHPSQDRIKIDDVLQKQDLQLAVLSSFQWDDDWLLSKLDVTRTKMLFVATSISQAHQEEMRVNSGNRVKFCFPSMEGIISSMHSKLMILSYSSHLRIAVPTANLVPYDWGEPGYGRSASTPSIMENAVFLIDLPRIHGNASEQKATSQELPPFGRELLRFLEALGIEQSLIRGLRNFDFSRTSSMAFVHSIGGSHAGDALRYTGYCGLGAAVKELGLQTTAPLSIDFTTASLGALNIDFLKQIYLASQGDDGMTEFSWRMSKKGKSRMARDSNLEAKTEEMIREHFRVYFPTRETVVASRGGPNAGGTICLQRKWFETKTFPRELLRDCQSQCKGLLMHNKMLFARPLEGNLNSHHKSESSVEQNKEYAGWAYIGSANLSEAAWGKLVQDGTTKQPKLNCRNWECGVLLAVPAKEHSHDGEAGGPKSLNEVFDGVVPVPMVVPGEEYGKREPWFFMEHK